MKAKPITIEQEIFIKENLTYIPSTGVLAWVKSGSGRDLSKPAGSLCKIGSYIKLKCLSRKLMAHRIAWFLHYGHWPKGQIDHINQDKTDNRIENLRDVSHKINGRNQCKALNNKSGITGVSWCKHANKWSTQIKVKGKQISLGYHKDFELACSTRKEAEIKYNFHPNHGK